jgi:hypothetical protein
MFRTAARKYQCVFDDGKQYDLELALKKDKFTFVWIGKDASPVTL